jgi:precorrin-6B methylase 2
MENEKKSYFFKLSADSLGPIAVGSGFGPLQAMRDAAGRVSLGPAGEGLAAALRAGNAHVVKAPSDRLIDHGEHGYVTRETAMVAEIAACDEAACRHIETFTGNLSELVASLHAKFRGEPGKLGIDHRLVDWVDLVEGFHESLPRAILAELRGEAAAAAARPQAEVADLVAGSGRAISPEVRGILASCTLDGNMVRLPEGRLDRKLYEGVNEVLVALGGKWVGRKVQAHVFDEDPAPMLDIAVSTGSYVKPQDFGFFETQRPEVELAIQRADLRPGQKVMEPSAGRGAIAIEMAKIVGFDNVTVVELLQGNARKLREAGFSAVNTVDFLSIDPVPIYDRIVMNPPFSGLADIKHVMHAARFLKPTGRLVAITSPSWTFNSARRAEEFRDFVDDCEGKVDKIDAGAFKAVGTNIETRMVTMDAQNFPWNREIPVERERMRA